MFLREHDVFHKKQTDEEGKRMLDLLFFCGFVFVLLCFFGGDIKEAIYCSSLDI